MESPALSRDPGAALMGALQVPPFSVSTRVVNPRAAVSCIQGKKRLGFKIDAPVRGENRRQTLISHKSVPELHHLFLGLLVGEPAERLASDAVIAALETAGLLVPPQKVPEAVHFSARLTEEELDAMAGALRETPEEATALTSLPSEWNENPADHHVWWFDDRDRGVEWPCSLSDAQLTRLLTGRHGREASLALPSAERDGGQASTWPARLAAAREQIARSGYAVVRDLIPVPFLRGVQDYYARLIANGYLMLGDGQSQRYSLHNERLARWVHLQTRRFIASAIPEAVKPSYSYTGFYVGGAVLDRHTDREQCEYTLSLTMDAAPSRAREDAWPLCLDLPDGSRVEALLAPGDGLIFKGRELPHYRERLADDRTSRSIFFHYVPEAYTGSLA